MHVSDIGEGVGTHIVTASRNKSVPAAFSKTLSSAVNKTVEKSSKPEDSGNSKPRGSGKDEFIEIGKISKETPTVSQILKNHPVYRQKCWEIVFSSVNKGKPYTTIPDGTAVVLKKGSNELLWGKELSMAKDKAAAEPAGNEINTTRAKGLAEKSIIIGTISGDYPTVSHLFQANPRFDKFWKIIHAPINSGKPYTSLRPGTEVKIDTETMELSFVNTSREKSTGATPITPGQAADNRKINVFSLADAVRPYIGTSYNKIDCYGLIVRGLMNQGVKYHGHGGLREILEGLARRDGLPGNAYLNGEGLVEKAGKKIFSKSINRISNTREKTMEIYSGMAPYLREGLILSFSTPTRGHTGVVSKKGDDWTYINSGVIDHEISSDIVSERVGEEFLREEIKNWFALATERMEPLTVTLGEVDSAQLQDFIRSEANDRLATLYKD